MKNNSSFNPAAAQEVKVSFFCPECVEEVKITMEVPSTHNESEVSETAACSNGHSYPVILTGEKSGMVAISVDGLNDDTDIRIK